MVLEEEKMKLKDMEQQDSGLAEHGESVPVPVPPTEQQQQIPPFLTPIYSNLSGDEIQAGYFYSVNLSCIKPEWPEFLNKNNFVLVVAILPDGVKIQYAGRSDYYKFVSSFENATGAHDLMPDFSCEWLMTMEQAEEMLNKRMYGFLEDYANRMANYWLTI